LWDSIKPLVQVKAEDEPQILFRVAANLMLPSILEGLAEVVRESPIFQRMIEKEKVDMQAMAGVTASDEEIEKEIEWQLSQPPVRRELSEGRCRMFLARLETERAKQG
jgi:hypothetical protein